MSDKHSTHSTLRERIVEHCFVGDSLRRLWQLGVLDVEVLRPEFDAHGYDLVMTRGDIVRHIQFKTGTAKTPGDVSVGLALAKNPSSCVIWIRVDNGLSMGPYFWFGSDPGKPMPPVDEFQVPRRPTHNKAGVRPERRNHRLIPKESFERVETLDAILTKLFGNLQQQDAD